MNRTTLALSLGASVLGLAPLAAQAAPKPPKPGPQNSLTIAASPSPVVFGRSTAISGKLLGPNPAGQKINVRSDPFPFDNLAVAGSVTTNATGDWTLAQSPTVNTRYEARAGKVQSTVITVLVRPAVTLRLSDYTPKRGQRVRFAGRVCPEHDGSRLAIQRRSADGKYRTVTRTLLRDVAGSTCSSYRQRLRIRRDGRYRAVIGAHADHTTGRSRSRRADAHS
jgi:hypothetical protein